MSKSINNQTYDAQYKQPVQSVAQMETCILCIFENTHDGRSRARLTASETSRKYISTMWAKRHDSVIQMGEHKSLM